MKTATAQAAYILKLDVKCKVPKTIFLKSDGLFNEGTNSLRAFKSIKAVKKFCAKNGVTKDLWFTDTLTHWIVIEENPLEHTIFLQYEIITI